MWKKINGSIKIVLKISLISRWSSLCVLPFKLDITNYVLNHSQHSHGYSFSEVFLVLLLMIMDNCFLHIPIDPNEGTGEVQAVGSTQVIA